MEAANRVGTNADLLPQLFLRLPLPDRTRALAFAAQWQSDGANRCESHDTWKPRGDD